jgi:MSHA biogenesis protein MshQ
MTPSVTNHPAAFLNETLAPGIYDISGAGSLGGVITLDAGYDPDAIFVFRFAGAFNVAAAAKIILAKGAKRCNVFWLGGAGVATGAVNIGASSEVKGTFMSHGGASNSGGGVFMAGRQLSTLGAVNTNTAVIYNNPQCVTSSSLNTPSFDHFQIEHDGQGLTCAPEEVTIKACADANCETFNMDAIDVDLSIYNQTDDTLFKTIPITVNGTTAVMKDTNIPANFSYTNSGRVRLAIENQDYECKNGSSDSCEVKFTKAGFRFLYGDDTTLPNQIAGTVFEKALKLQAVVDDEGVCTGLFKDDISVNLWQENVKPSGTSGLSFSIDGHDIAKEQGEPLTELIFDDDSIATIENPRYHDAGEIRLHANYDVDGITLSGSSNPFWVSPAELVVSATSGTSKLNGAAATDTTTHVAGESFTLTVSALNSRGDITPNYTPGTIQLKLERTGPILEDSVDGRLTYASDASLATATGTSTVFENVTLNNFSSGQSVYTDAQYSEVGLLNLTLRDSNYGVPGIVIDATAIDIGRFIPHHFTQTIAEDGAFMADCNTATATSFAYSGQKDVNNKGAISYVTNPVLAITAYNKQNVITENYSNAYMKLSAEDVSITAPTVDQKAIGDDDVILLLTANMNEGILSQNDLTALPDALDNGVLHYQFSDSDNFFYNRDANTQVAPFISEINFSTASITDADGVTVETTVDASPEGVEIRFGRLVLQNSFGPETSDLPQPMQIEYFTDDGFIVSSDNNCVSYDSTNIILDTTLTTRALPEHPAATTGNFLAGKTRTIKLAAPGAGNQGKIGVSYNASDWLRYDWNPDDDDDNENPTATATFGLFRGNDRIIYQREVFE